MARLVIPKSKSGGNFADVGGTEQLADGYVDRLVKYLPVESISFYAGIDKVVSSHFGIDSTTSTATHAPTGALIFAILFFVLGLIGTPIYLYRRRLAGQPWKLNVIISTVAFVLWAYTLGGSLFVIFGWYSVFVAGLLAPVFTFVAGWFEPAPK